MLKTLQSPKYVEAAVYLQFSSYNALCVGFTNVYVGAKTHRFDWSNRFSTQICLIGIRRKCINIYNTNFHECAIAKNQTQVAASPDIVQLCNY
jgi:predicted helicase